MSAPCEWCDGTIRPGEYESVAWMLAQRIEKLESVQAKLIQALEHCRHRPHEHNPGPEFTITRCDVIDRALALAAKE